MVAVSLITGILLKFAYLPVPDRAYESVAALFSASLFGPFIRNLHHWSATFLLTAVFLHMLRVFYTAGFKAPRRVNWLIGLVLLGTVCAANFTGYLLPWDQLAFWAVTICAGMLAYLPGLGGWLQQVVIGGSELGPATLANFFAIHTAVVPALLLILLPFHFWRIRKAGGLVGGPSHTPKSNQATTPGTQIKRETVATVPDLLARELAMAALTLAALMTVAALFDAPLGPEANPGLSPNPTKAPWYFAGFQELLLHFHPIVAVAIIPPLLVAGLVFLPFLPYPIETPGRWFNSHKGGRLAAIAAILGMICGSVWIVGYAGGWTVLSWLAPATGAGIMSILFGLTRRKSGATPHDAVQALFTFVLVVFLVLTATGIWFRGASMALIWPWQ